MLSILHQDPHLVAVHKPAGLLVHRSGLDAGETRFALQLLRDQLGRPVWPAHRLDKGTSGVLLFALSAEVATRLGALWQGDDEGRSAVQKHYLAVVRGWPRAADGQAGAGAAGVVDHPLKRMADELRGSAHRSARATQVQPARTQWQTLAHYSLPLAQGDFAQTRCALLALQPHTGRRHQLRRHCKHMAHPIIGDATHGKGPLNRALAECLGVQRLWLHAHRIALPHPVSGEPLCITAPPGDEWGVWAPYLLS